MEAEIIAGYSLADLIPILGQAVAGIVILIVGWFVAGWVRSLIQRSMDRPSMDKTLARFAANLTYYAVLILTIFVALDTVGVEVVAFVGVLAAAGFAVGLALQGTLANFAAGVMLLIFRPFNVGDFVEIGGETGFVRAIQLFYTQIDTRDNRRIIVPNGDVFGSTITNAFYHDVVRVDVDVGTDYPEDIDSVREVLIEAAESIDDRVEERGVQAALVGLGDSSIDWQVRIWAESDDFFRLRQELTRAVKYKLDEADVGIPFPQMDVHLDKLNSN